MPFPSLIFSTCDCLAWSFSDYVTVLTLGYVCYKERMAGDETVSPCQDNLVSPCDTGAVLRAGAASTLCVCQGQSSDVERVALQDGGRAFQTWIV